MTLATVTRLDQRREQNALAALRERPSEVLPDASQLVGHVVFDLETSGLFPDDGATVAAVGVAYRIDREQIHYHSFAFDQGNAASKGMTVQYHLDTPTTRARKVSSLPKGDPHNQWDWNTDYNLPEIEWVVLCRWLQEAGEAVGLANQNIKFDIGHFRNGTRFCGGVDLERYIAWDPMLASPQIWPRAGTIALKPVAARIWGEDAVAEAKVVTECLVEVSKRYGLKPSDKRYDLMPWSVNGPYVASDAVLALRLGELQRCMIADGYASGARIDRAIQVCRVLTRMERRGFGPFDVQQATEIADRIDDRIAQLSQALPFSPATGPRAATYFFDELGLAPWKVSEQHRVVTVGPDTRKNAPEGATQRKVTKQGDLSAAVAHRMAQAQVPHADAWAEITELSIANKMFYRNYADLAGPDGQIRTSFKQAFVRSGRLSVERFQAQAMPKKLKILLDGQPLPQPRSLFGVAPGKVRMVLDLSQAELRIASLLAGCQLMSDALANGDDLHGITTKRVFDIEPDHPDWKQYRDNIGKRLNFAPTTVDTPIPTPTGWKRADEICVGDTIYSRRGTTRVLEVQPVGRIPVYRMTLFDGRYVDVGALHHWHTLHTYNPPSQYSDDIRAVKIQTTIELAQELKRAQNSKTDRGSLRGYVNLPFAEPVEHPDADLPADPYLLGLWLGDGLRTSQRPEVRIAIYPPDIDHYIGVFGPPHRTDLSGAVLVYNWAGRGVGCKPDRTKVSNQTLQHAWVNQMDLYEQGSLQQRLALLRGLMDSDGSVSAPYSQVTFSNTDKAKADLVVRLVNSLGGYARVHTWQPKYPESRLAYSVHVQTRLNPFLLARKAQRFKPMKRCMARVASVEPLNVEQEAVCYRVDSPDKTYLVGDHVVTHNCVFQVGGRKFRETLWEEGQIDWSLARCTETVYTWRGVYPEFGNAYYEWMEFAERNQYVPLVDGHPSWLAGPRDYPSSAWNRRVQGSLALFADEWIVQVEKRTARYDALVLTVHDSCVLDLPQDAADEICAELAEMTQRMWVARFGIPGRADVSRWQTDG